MRKGVSAFPLLFFYRFHVRFGARHTAELYGPSAFCLAHKRLRCPTGVTASDPREPRAFHFVRTQERCQAARPQAGPSFEWKGLRAVSRPLMQEGTPRFGTGGRISVRCCGYYGFGPHREEVCRCGDWVCGIYRPCRFGWTREPQLTPACHAAVIPGWPNPR